MSRHNGEFEGLQGEHEGSAQSEMEHVAENEKNEATAAVETNKPSLNDAAFCLSSSIGDNDVRKVWMILKSKWPTTCRMAPVRMNHLVQMSEKRESNVSITNDDLSVQNNGSTLSQAIVDRAAESESSPSSGHRHPEESASDFVDLSKEPNYTYRDLTSAKKNLDASSMAFIERLRGAAHRRKLRVARSRDSLAAKEREHLLSIASANERRLLMAPKDTTVRAAASSVDHMTTVEPYKPFKARPAPSTTGQLGSGGQVGVPKVEKKPTTTPFSPLLGARRPKNEHVSALDTPSKHAPRRSASRFVSIVTKSLTPKKSRGVPFKARPAPPTTGIQGHAGQVGVPKVAKRPATVPVSPGLGIRRSSLPVAFKPKMAGSKSSAAAPKRNKPFERAFSGSDVSRLLYSLLFRNLE